MGDLSRVENSIPVQIVDANDLQVVDIQNTTPVGTESGIIVRNIPSGTQNVSGTVTANAGSGTYTVGGTVTSVPSGTQLVNGTITAVQASTYTVVGSGTAGTAAAGVVTVQGIANGISLAVDLSNNSYKSKGTNQFTTVSPTISATLIVNSNANRTSLLIYNAGSATVYLGKSGSMTTGNGVPLLPNANIEDTESTDSWYGITDGATGDLRIIETAI